MAHKLFSMEEAIRRFVLDGDTVVMGTALEPMIPFAAGHEMIRQKKRNLTLVGPISDILFDQLIGAGCVDRLTGAWAGNVSEGSGYNFRRAVEDGVPQPLQLSEHSNFTLALGLLAGQLGVPFLPTRTILGSDILKINQGFRSMVCPFSGDRLVMVPAIRPDVAILHLPRADAQGNGQAWGSIGVTKEAALASRRIVLVVEEVVERDVIARDPSRTIIPGFLVDAVVEESRGAHPSPVPGYYNRDHAHYTHYHHATRERRHFLQWLQDWVLGIEDRADYLNRIGEDRLNRLRICTPCRSDPVDYGC
jgi:glutaconate CoA-transferase subunit A